MKLPKLHLRDLLQVRPEVIELVPASVAHYSFCLPLSHEGDCIEFAVTDTFDREMVDKLRFILNTQVRLRDVNAEDLTAAILHHYGPEPPLGPDIVTF